MALRPQRDGLGEVAVQHAQVRLDAVGVGQRRARRQRAQHGDGAAARGLGLGVAPGADQRGSVDRQALAFPQPVAGLAVDVARLGARAIASSRWSTSMHSSA